MTQKHTERESRTHCGVVPSLFVFIFPSQRELVCFTPIVRHDTTHAQRDVSDIFKQYEPCLILSHK